MLEQYYHFNEATGVSITLRQPDEGDIEVNACSILVQNKQLSFERKITGLNSLEALTKQIPAKSIIALNLSGKGVLQKQTERTEEINQHNFNKILPNANIEDFYVQNFISGDQSFISVIRKTEADKWISQLKAFGFIPLTLSLGPFPVHNIVSQLNVYGAEIIFNGHTIMRNEQAEWVSCNYDASATTPFPLKIESEPIDEKLLSAYASAFQVVMAGKLDPVQAIVPELTSEFQKRTEAKKLKVQAFMVLTIFFALLLVNFMLFSWLNSSNAKLAGQVSLTAQSDSDMRQVNKEIHQKVALLDTLGWESGINKSTLIDQVASLMPSGITWREAAIDPVDLGGSRSQVGIVFFKRKIRITGNSALIIPVNEWIARIKTRPWVKNIQIESYAFNSELNTGAFIIEIDY